MTINNDLDWSKVVPSAHWEVKTGTTINEQNRSVYLWSVISLGIVSISSLAGIIWLSLCKIDIPQGLIAIGSVAVGALGSLFTHNK